MTPGTDAGVDGRGIVVTALVVLVALLVVTRASSHRRSTTSRRRLHGPGRTSRSVRARGLVQHIVDAATRRRTQRRTSATRADDLATLLGEVARRCASGASLTSSLIAATGPARTVIDFRSVRRRLDGGASIAEALPHTQDSDPEGQLAVHVLRMCALHGGNVSESLDRAAATLRERHTARLERLAQAAQATLSARVLTVVPLAFGGWTLISTPSVRHFAFTPVGIVVLMAGALLNLAGWTLMSREIRGDPR